MSPDDLEEGAVVTDVDRLVRQLHQIQQRLHELTSGEVDAVIGPTGQAYLLPDAQQQLILGSKAQRRKVATQVALLDALPAHVALLDANGVIVSVNQSWQGYASACGWSVADFAVGRVYADCCGGASNLVTHDALRIGEGVRAVLHRDLDSFAIEYRCGATVPHGWYRMTVTSLLGDAEGGAVVMHVDISERKEAERAALESERRYRSIVELLPDVVFTSEDNRITFMNAAGVRLLEATHASELVGRAPLSLFADDRRESRRDRIARLAQVPAQVDFVEDRMVTLGGRLVDVEVAASSHVQDGHVVIEIVCRDITERKRAAEESRQLGERLSSTLEHLSDPFGIVDFDWKLIYANRKGEQMLGIARSELLGQVLWDRLPGLEQSPFGEALHRARSTNAQVDMVAYYPVVHRWFDMRVQPTADGLALYLRDVTASHDLATEFEAEHARLVAAQSVAKLGSWDMDLTGNDAVDWSDEMHRICETDPQTWQPTPARFFEQVHPEDRAGFTLAFERSLGLEATELFEHRIEIPDGRVKIVEERWQVFHDEAGIAVRALGSTQDITERRQAEHALQRSQEMLDIAGDMAKVGGWSFEVEPRLLQWSPVVHALHEESLEYEPVVERELERYVDEHRSVVGEAFRRCVEDGAPFDVEAEISNPRGGRRWVRVIGKAERDAHGRIVRGLGAFQDITPLKRSEQTAREHVERLRTTLESITDGFFTLDLDFRFEYINPRAEQLLGRDRDSLFGRAIWDEFPASRGSVSQQHYEHAMREQTAVGFEDYYPPLGMWFEANAYPSKQGLAVYFRDITARRRDSERMKLLETCVERLNDIVVIMDLDFAAGGPKILFVNDAFVRATGYNREETIGRTPELLYGPNTDMVEVARVRGLLARFEVASAQLLYCTKSGDDYWVEVVFVPVIGTGTQFSHLVAVARDVNERKRDQDALRELNADLEARVVSRTVELELARNEAEQASVAKSAFLATMSHEIRTPMNGVIGMLDVLGQTSLKDYQVEMLDLIHDSAIVLLQIIEDILDFSKIEAGKLAIEHEPFSLADTVEKVCGLLDHIAVKLRVRMTVFIDPAIPALIVGDETRVRQVLVNLVGNAIKFCSAGPEQGDVSVRAILVETRDHVAEVDLIVVDNGIGIDPVTQARLFTPFSQADASTTRRFGGTGLGLAICQMLVQLMDGRITLVSAPGEGASFTVRLRFAEVSPVVDPSDDDVAPLVRGLCCAVIGDEQPLACDLEAYLTAAGAHVRRCGDPAAAAAASTTLMAASSNLAPSDPGKPEIWLVLPAVKMRSVHELRALVHGTLHASARFVVFGRGKRRRPRADYDDLVTLDVDLLFRRSLFKAVALAAGRLQLEPAEDQVVAVRSDVAVPLRRDAIRQGRLVLVAEDNETNRKVIQKQLELIGFSADLVVNGREALERWRSGDFSVLLTDLQMPTMDGYALTAAIRAEERARGLHRTPIIVLTANAIRDEERRCLAAGMDAYLTKPVRLAVLKATIEDWLGINPPDLKMVEGAHWASPQSRPMDLNVLTDLVGDNEAVVNEILQAFRLSARQCAVELQAGFDAGSMQTVGDASHRLKSAARSVGAEPLADLCAALQDAAECARTETAAELFERFAPALGAVERFLESR